MRLSFLIGLLCVSLMAKEYPKIYASLSDKLFEAPKKLQTLQYNDILKRDIEAYIQYEAKVYAQGMKLESSSTITSKQKQEYLASLRALSRQYDKIVQLLQNSYLSAMQNDDYERFSALSNAGIDEIFHSKKMLHAMQKYYETHKHLGRIAVVEKVLADAKIPVIYTTEINKKQEKKKHNHIPNVPLVDQKNIPLGSEGGLEITKRQSVAQTFRVGRDGILTSIDIVDVSTHRCRPNESLYLSLINVKENKLGAISYYTRQVHPDEIHNQQISMHLRRASLHVKKGEQYAIYLSSHAQPSKCTYSWGGGFQTYDAGQAFINASPDERRDMKFKTYILTP